MSDNYSEIVTPQVVHGYAKNPQALCTREVHKMWEAAAWSVIKKLLKDDIHVGGAIVTICMPENGEVLDDPAAQISSGMEELFL
jgi:hypothetical protein